MGYTHYIRPARVLSQPEWKRFTRIAKCILENAPCPIAGWDGEGNPEITMERVSFNGAAPDDYETCTLERGATGFNFTKTARRPYDPVALAVYFAFELIHGGSIVDSDGNNEGEARYRASEGLPPWNREGCELLSKALVQLEGK